MFVRRSVSFHSSVSFREPVVHPESRDEKVLTTSMLSVPNTIWRAEITHVWEPLFADSDPKQIFSLFLCYVFFT